MKVGTFDTEADGLLDEATRVWCAVVYDETNDIWKEFTPDTIDQLCSYLDTFDVLKGHHCIGYDFPLLRRIFGFEFRGTKVDTLLMSRTQRPNRKNPKGIHGVGPHSVESWGQRLGFPKKSHEDWSQFSPEMLIRCKQDVFIQIRIFETLIEEGKGEGWREAHKLNFKLFHYLQLQEECGWPVDHTHIDVCLRTLTHWVDRVDRVVSKLLPVVVEQGRPVNKPFKKDGSYAQNTVKYLNDETVCGQVGGPFTRVTFRAIDLDRNSEVKKVLLSMGWVPDEWNTNNAGERTSPKLSINDSFQGIRGGLGKLIVRRVQCKQRRGVIEGLAEQVREDGRVAARVSGIAATGRLRHSGIVNIPSPHSKAFFARQMREIFIAPQGYKLVGIDSAGNQARQLAARMGDADFTYAVLHGDASEGTDLHSLNQKRSGAPSRSRAKNFFYGLIFGAGDKKLGMVIDGTAEQGRRLRETYFRELPKLKLLIDKIVQDWRNTAKFYYNKKFGRMEYREGFIPGLDGRPVKVDSEHMLLCYYLQSDEAIQMGKAYVLFNEWMEESGYIIGDDYWCVIWMHDEFQVICKEELVDVCSTLGCKAIHEAGRHYNIAVPHAGEALVGDNWYMTH